MDRDDFVKVARKNMDEEIDNIVDDMINFTDIRAAIKKEVEGTLDDLFLTDDDRFWSKFDEAVVGTFENDVYRFRLEVSANGLSVGVPIESLDPSKFPKVAFRSLVNELESWLSFLDPSEQDECQEAVIADLEHALEVVRKWGS